MKNLEKKLILFLSDANLTDNEFRQLVRLILSSDARRCISAAEHLRSIHRDVLRHFQGEEIDQEVYERSKQLLIVDAKLAANRAVKLLADELGATDVVRGARTLREGLRRLLQRTDGSAVLSAAHRVSKRVRKDTSRHAWSLDSSETK